MRLSAAPARSRCRKPWSTGPCSTQYAMRGSSKRLTKKWRQGIAPDCHPPPSTCRPRTGDSLVLHQVLPPLRYAVVARRSWNGWPAATPPVEQTLDDFGAVAHVDVEA